MPRSGLIALADGVRRYFEANGVAAVVAVGLKQRFFQINQGPGGASRIVFIPGDFDGTEGSRPLDEGEIGDPMGHTSTNPRELAQWSRVCTVAVWGVDTTKLEDEALQIEATEDLLERTVEAIHNCTGEVRDVDDLGRPITAVLGHLGADVTWGKISGVYPPLENGFGRELLLRFTLSGPLYDQPIAMVRGQAGTFTKTFTEGANTP